jgi:hypothetical protein
MHKYLQMSVRSEKSIQAEDEYRKEVLSAPVCYCSNLGLNPDIYQNTKNGDISIEMANILARTKKIYKKEYRKKQCFVSGSGFNQVIGSVSRSGFGIWIRIQEGKNRKKLENSCFEVLDVLFEG